MGLIEKAVGLSSEPQAQRQVLASADESGASRAFDVDFPWLAAHGFYTPEERSSRLSLELRVLKRNLLRRTGLRTASGENRSLRRTGAHRNVVLVTSARPHEGKTFCAINLALSLAFEEGYETFLIDGDMPRPKIRAHFGLAQGPGLSERLRDPALSLSAITQRARQAPLMIVGEGQGAALSPEELTAPEAQRLFNGLSLGRPKRIVIIDAPPVLASHDALYLARHADEVIFVVEADSTPTAAAASALDELLEANQNVSLVLNRCLIGAGGRYYDSYSDYGRETDTPGDHQIS